MYVVFHSTLIPIVVVRGLGGLNDAHPDPVDLPEEGHVSEEGQ